MANELTLVHELELPIPMTCADGTGIEKGTLLELSDPSTAAKVSGAAPVVIGVAAAEKNANDGVTTIPVYLRGVFIATAGGTITVGAGLIAEDGTNEVLTATAAADAAQIFGTAMETAADGETFKVYLNVGIGGSPET
jgi:subtilisin family serine protease